MTVRELIERSCPLMGTGVIRGASLPLYRPPPGPSHAQAIRPTPTALFNLATARAEITGGGSLWPVLLDFSLTGCPKHRSATLVESSVADLRFGGVRG